MSKTISEERRERLREAGRRGGQARAKQFTPQSQRAARRKVSKEACARNGAKGARVTMERYGYETLFRKCRRHRLLNPSKGELAMVGILSTLGLRSEREWRIGSTFYTVDFYLPAQRKAIEVDGKVHRVFDPEKRTENDRRKAELLGQAGIELLRIDHTEIRDVDAVIDRVRRFAGDRK